LAIADAAGGDWPERARKAAVLCCQIDEDDGGQIEALLADIREAFHETMMGETKVAAEISSADLVKRLVAMEGRPWAEIGKSRKPLTQNKLARMLKPLGIGPNDIGPEDNRLKGYKRERFNEAFERYLPPGIPFQTAHPRSDPQDQGLASNSKVRSRDPLRGLETSASHCNSDILRGCAVAKGKNGDATRACAHRGKTDGREEFCAFGDEELWLHPECQAAFARSRKIGGGGDDGLRP
jgi:hypothetical protein